MRVIPSETNATGELSFKGSKHSVPRAFTGVRPRDIGLHDLLADFEQACKAHSDEVAIYQRDLRSKAGESRYFALKFRELHSECDAWFQRLRSTGLGDQDRVVVALPRGLAWLAACYALLRMGCEICFASDDPSESEAIVRFKPTAAIGVGRTIKKLGKRLPGSAIFIEVSNPLERISQVASDVPAATDRVKRLRSGISMVRLNGMGRPSLVRLDPEQLSTLSHGARLVLGEPVDQCSISRDLIFQLFFPAWGMGTAYLDDGYKDKDNGSYARRCREAINDLSARTIVETPDFWHEILDDDSEPLKIDKAVFIGSENLSTRVIQSYLRRLPSTEILSVFATPEIPVAAFCDLRLVEFSLTENFDQRPIGWFLPGIAASVISTSVAKSKNGGEREVVPEMGTLQVGWLEDGLSGKLKRGSLRSTPHLAFEGSDGCYWLCGDASDILNTNFGAYIPQRCEAVFLRNSKVKGACLFPLRISGQNKAAILIVVDSENLPKDAKEEARLKAELMRVGAECEDTKMILDIYFTDKCPKIDKKSGKVDRNALSKKYGRFSFLKSLF